MKKRMTLRKQYEGDEERKKNTTVIVYKQGALAPIEGVDVIYDQMRLGHRYRNTLTEIEGGRRTAIRGVVGAAMLDLAQMENDLAAAKERVVAAEWEVKVANAKTRSRSATEAAKQAVKDAKAECRAIRDKIREARRAAFDLPEVQEQLVVIKGHANTLGKSARAYSGLGRLGPYSGAFGTYQLVEKAAFQAGKTTPFYDDNLPRDPKFVRRGSRPNHISVQIDGGASPEEVLAGTHSQVRIVEGPRAKKCNHHNHRPEDCYGGTQPYLRLKLATGHDGKPDVWGAWPLVPDRPLPKDALIKRVTVTSVCVGPRTHWTVEFTLQFPKKPVPTKGKGTVAIDLGWPKIGGGLRAASWCDENGFAGELCITPKQLSRFEKVNDLRSIRDTRFNEARDRLVNWLHGAEDVPDWLRAATATLALWKSQARLAGLASRWSRTRFPGDEEVFGRPPTKEEIEAGIRGPGLAGWAAQDRHLWEWESNQRRAVLFERRELYRRFAVKLTTKYAHVLLPDVDYSKLGRKKPAESDRVKNDTADRHRTIVSPGDLRSIIERAAAKRGARSERVKVPVGACPACGALDKAHVDVAHHGFACTHCTYVGDLDKAQVLVMLRLAEKNEEVAGILRRGNEVSDLLTQKHEDVFNRWQVEEADEVDGEDEIEECDVAPSEDMDHLQAGERGDHDGGQD